MFNLKNGSNYTLKNVIKEFDIGTTDKRDAQDQA